jgi:2-haloacid dehalogenase
MSSVRGRLAKQHQRLSEIAQAYKPSPEAYLRNAEALMLKPERICCRGHNYDLAARFCTGFIPRPREHGADQTMDLESAF